MHPDVAKTITAHSGAEANVFRPSIGKLIDNLAINPKQYPKKQGKLKTARAAPLHYSDGVTWRAVYIVDDAARTVFVIALGPHDTAYQQAVRRI
ncbi:MAG: type II toxin-antitoxin system RelE/ParE family toxin [Candidatus Eremiobacteraeota bacterium]|nr:type II toxin-antitoxin system RelE/ParE family toxin [Candidatus Eremiobacteraeota bacterium]